MLGDGKTSYDHDHDGEGTMLGGCSANYRRTNVATKLKITYIKDTTLNVSFDYIIEILVTERADGVTMLIDHRFKYSIKLVSWRTLYGIMVHADAKPQY